jgi:hypothetical protein
MSEDNDFFAMPAQQEQDVDNNDPQHDAPIILGPPDDQPSYFGGAEAMEPTYLGDVNEAPAFVSDDHPIVLMTTASSDEEEAAATPEAIEPSPMQTWNAEWQETLKTRKDEENDGKAALLEKAAADMEVFQSAREQRRDTKMALNRSDEQAKLEAIEADLENDNSWQRACKMIELSHDNKADAEDVKRMRDVMILLKNEPTRATALIS